MKKLSILVVLIFLFSACSPASVVPKPTITLTNTATLPPTETLTPGPTFTPTVIPTSTLSPDINIYNCAENVSKENCDFVKDAVRLARYNFSNNYGADISAGVKFEIINDPKDIKRGEGGSAGIFQIPKQGDPFVWINTGHPKWLEFATPEFQHNNTALVVHEFTHAWQWQHGCINDILNDPSSPTGFLTQGYAQYNGLTVSGVDYSDNAFSDALALSFWQASAWNENKWFDNTDVNVVVVKHLVDAYGFKSFTQYCDAVGKGVKPNDAFQSAYGISIFDFRTEIKEMILGSLKNCSVATCGAGVDNYNDIYKLKHLIDKIKTTPNLILNFVDENNKPVALTHLTLWRQDFGGDGQIVDYAQSFETTPTFSVAILPGRYIFVFCEPGYPVDHSDWECQWHETDWIDVYPDKVTNLTFQVLSGVQKAGLTTPDIEVKFTDKDGNPIANLGIQICNYDTSVKVCTPTYPIAKTNASGVYKGSLRRGKYLIRVPLYPNYLNKYDFQPFYEIEEINIDEGALTSANFQFPKPNLIIKFLDVNGNPVPEQSFLLCKIASRKEDCTSSVSLWGRYAFTGKTGIFEARVEPGEYYILTCKSIDCPSYDVKITGIIVVSDTQVTTVEYSLYKK